NSIPFSLIFIETKPRENPLLVLVRHPQHSDAVKIYVPQNADVHDVK
ncbi:12964_t:CDS:1, partial [Ambispora leptoticha]